MDRREFLKLMGLGSAAAVLPGCVPGKSDGNGDAEASEAEAGEMTYRQFP